MIPTQDAWWTGQPASMSFCTCSPWAYNSPVPDYFCYILECADGSYYTGWTTDPERRLREHSAGRGARYTRSRRPLRIAYLEEAPDRSAAMRRERAIKSLTRRQKQRLLNKYQPKDEPL